MTGKNGNLAQSPAEGVNRAGSDQWQSRQKAVAIHVMATSQKFSLAIHKNAQGPKLLTVLGVLGVLGAVAANVQARRTVTAP